MKGLYPDHQGEQFSFLRSVHRWPLQGATIIIGKHILHAFPKRHRNFFSTVPCTGQSSPQLGHAK